MGTHASLVMGMIAAFMPGAASDGVVLQNEHLTVTFEQSGTGPHLATVKCEETGETHHFEDAEPVSLFVVPADAIHDPALPVTFTTQKRCL